MPKPSVKKKVAKKPAKKVRSKATAKAKKPVKAEVDLQIVAGWIECASSVADALRERCGKRVEGLASDIRFATLSRDVWREHDGKAPELLALLDRYLDAANAQSTALTELVTQLAPYAELPDEQHVHLEDGTVKVDRIRAANVMHAKE
jgi:hypothetical protein